MTDNLRLGRWLAITLLVLAVFRLWFAAALPMTGDEAYFVAWGRQLAGGYYDHPPMVGWWLAGLLAVGRSEWWLRLPAVLLPFVLAWGAWSLLRHESERRARYAALLTLLQPADVWNVLITTDTPVILFSLLSVLAYVRGVRAATTRTALGWQALAGLLLGAAFLGKYFAALLGVAFAIHVLGVRRDRGRLVGLVVLTLCALLGPAWNLNWNAGHCWSNLLFNFVNRNERAGFDWRNPVLFVASLAYLATPWLLWALSRARASMAGWPQRGAADGIATTMAWLAGVPLAVFALMSLAKSVGLHWLLAFMPLLAVLAAAILTEARLVQLVRWSAAFAAVHVVAAVVFLALPLSVWQGSRLHAGAVLTFRGEAVAEALRAPLARCGARCTLAMESYSSAATLAYALDRPVAVFGDGSFHGRQDDFDTDFHALDGGDFVILRKETLNLAAYAPYFERVEADTFTIDGIPFYAVRGQGFRYAVYHDRVLKHVRDLYYRIDRLPGWLPRLGCPFTGRYFVTGAAS